MCVCVYVCMYVTCRHTAVLIKTAHIGLKKHCKWSKKHHNSHTIFNRVEFKTYKKKTSIIFKEFKNCLQCSTKIAPLGQKCQSGELIMFD